LTSRHPSIPIELLPHRTKNGYEHLLPLSDEAIRILRAAPHWKDVDYLFGKSDSPLSGFSKAKKTLDQRILYSRQKLDPNANPMPHWTLHDLRRAGSTLMHDSPADGGLGTPPHIVEAILTHLSGAKGGVAGVYNKAQYLSEKREALNQWSKQRICENVRYLLGFERKELAVSDFTNIEGL
jgi:integrase